MLIDKGLRQRWIKEALPVRQVTELDFLLGTSDITRQGALRFKLPGKEGYEAKGGDVPRMVSLPRLLEASNRICKDADTGLDDFAAVKMLLDAGTGSLGGARPKASVTGVDSDGREILYLAKFPHPGDRWDVMRWEKIALDLAEEAGIQVPESQLIKVGGMNVLLLKRFDRTDEGQRIGYMSIMTLLESEEGQSQDYLDMADAIAGISEATSDDLAQLWRRIVFSLAINNTDDHLRNHAILRSRKSWRLSPAFDLNPTPDRNAHRVTSIGGATSFEEGWKHVFALREWFGLSEKKMAAIKSDVLCAVRMWKQIAQKRGASDQEMRDFAPVLERGKHS
jgi:serine/threonine-protein kinase HipA